jgi:hypothetical protein
MEMAGLLAWGNAWWWSDAALQPSENDRCNILWIMRQYKYLLYVADGRFRTLKWVVQGA